MSLLACNFILLWYHLLNLVSSSVLNMAEIKKENFCECLILENVVNVLRLLSVEVILIFYGNSTGVSKPANKAHPVPRRTPPPPPSSVEPTRNTSQPSSRTEVGVGQLGAFWSTQHAKVSVVAEDRTRPKFDEEPTSHSTSKQDRFHIENHPLPRNTSPAKEANIETHAIRRNTHGKSHKSGDGPSKDFEIAFSQKDTDHSTERPKPSKTESTATFQDAAFNTFVAEFDTNKLSPGGSNSKSGKDEVLEAEVEMLKEQLKQANLEKAEITSKFEKLSTICRSQRQEIQELKQAVAARTPSPNKDVLKNQNLPGTRPVATPLVSYYMNCLCYSYNFQNWMGFVSIIPVF